MLRQVRKMRLAISPRLATRIFRITIGEASSQAVAALLRRHAGGMTGYSNRPGYATVHSEVLTGDVAAIPGEEEGDRPGDLLH